jgi:hypothetical protein
LKIQKRFVHLFGPKGNPGFVQAIQAIADRNIAEYNLMDTSHEGSAL